MNVAEPDGDSIETLMSTDKFGYHAYDLPEEDIDTKSDSSSAPPVQRQPVDIYDEESGNISKLKVDAAARNGNLILIAGWTSGRQDFALRANKRMVPFKKLSTRRDDVAQNLGLHEAEGIGFVIAARCDDSTALELCYKNAEGDVISTYSIECVEEADTEFVASGLFKSAIGMIAVTMRPFTEAWRALIKKVPAAARPCPTAKGFIEAGVTSDITGDTVLVGWEVHNPGTPVWLEDQSGRVFTLKNAYRRFRQDVNDVVDKEFGHANRDAGFIVRIKGGATGQHLYLKSVSEYGIHVLGEVVLTPLPAAPVAAAQWLFGIGTALSEAAKRVSLVDRKVLERLIAHHQEMWADLPVKRKFLGRSLANPKASMIVPLYGRTDFVEHQLIEFAQDPWLLEHVELIYVVDDPQIAERFLNEAEALYRIYNVPMSWVWGSVNRGFSGANNLGASVACGEHLVFLNSDAFPRYPGWVQPLIQVLDSNPEIGAVGPRLLFADGSLQHAGMQFLRREELGIWVNHHPNMGLDPELDPHQSLTILPSVTGACLVVRRKDFERIGGWDTGYLIGDFEDSDLCMKLRSEGLQIAYLPTVQLTHLERQSFRLLGENEFRTRVVIYNAVRHQERWRKFIEPQTSPESAGLNKERGV